MAAGAVRSRYRGGNKYVETKDGGGLFLQSEAVIDGAGNVLYRGSNRIVSSNLEFTWADEAQAETEVEKEIPIPSTWQPDGKYLIVVYNPSQATGLTGKVLIKVSNFGPADAGGRRGSYYVELKDYSGFDVSAANAETGNPAVEGFLVEGWMLGDGAKLILANKEALGEDEGFTAFVRIIQV